MTTTQPDPAIFPVSQHSPTLIDAGSSVRLPGSDPFVDHEMLAKVHSELSEAMRLLSRLGPCVTIFGSARPKPDSPWYRLTMDVAKAISAKGLNILTGGGPGLMEAANRGAYENGGYSVGLNIQLPHEQHVNPYVHQCYEFEYFFARKVMLLKYSAAVVCMPGGLGTYDELFETLTLIQTNKVKDMPVVLVGKQFWEQWLKLLGDIADKEGFFSRDDLKRIHISDSPEEIAAIIETGASPRIKRLAQRAAA